MAALILGLTLAGCSGSLTIGQPAPVVVERSDTLDTLAKAQELRVLVRQLSR